MLSGYKTHLAALVGLIVSFCIWMGWITPDAEAKIYEAIVVAIERCIAAAVAIMSLIAMFQRLATAKAEKKADEINKYGRLGMILFACVLVLPLLAACSQLSTPAGDPLSPPGAVCVNTERGRVCYMPHAPDPAPVLLPVPEK